MLQYYSNDLRSRKTWNLGFALAFCSLFLNSNSASSELSGQEHAFQSFSRSISPEQLNSILGSSDAVQKKIVSDKVAEMVLDKFKNLSPEQKSNLMELAKDFPRGRNTFDFESKKEQFEAAIQNDPELRKAAEELQSAMRDQNINVDRATRRELERDIRREIQERIQAEIDRQDFSNPNLFPNQNFDPQNNSNPNQIPFQNPRNNSSNNNFSNPDANTNGDPRTNGNRNGSPDPFNNLDPNRIRRDPSNNFNSNPGDLNQGTGGNSNSPNNESQSNPFSGFSDNGTNPPQTSPDASPNRASASGSKAAPPKESVGHRFNRMLMNSMEKAIEKKVGGSSGSEPRSFDRLLTKFMGTLAESNPNLNLNESGSGMLNRLSNSASRSKFSMPRLRGFGSPGRSSGPSFGSGMALPSVSPQGAMMFVLIVGLIVAAVVIAIKKTPIAQYLGLQPPQPAALTPPKLPNNIEEHEEIVTLVDRFTLWLFGQKAAWWNSKMVQQKIAQTSPEQIPGIKTVMKIYDQARYAETEQPVSRQTSEEIKSTLEKIRENATQKTGPA